MPSCALVMVETYPWLMPLRLSRAVSTAAFCSSGNPSNAPLASAIPARRIMRSAKSLDM